MTKLLMGLFLLAPVAVFAQGLNSRDLINLGGLTDNVSGLIATLIPIVFALALLFFLWGLARYILAAGDEDAKEQAKNIMIWGILALFIMASVWGIVAFLQDIFGVNNADFDNLPRVPR